MAASKKKKAPAPRGKKKATARDLRRRDDMIELEHEVEQQAPYGIISHLLGAPKRLYHWVLSFAHSPHSERALFGLSFAESSFFPVPPDVLLMPLLLGKPSK